MKVTVFLYFVLFVTYSSFGQNKKELEQKIIQLEEKNLQSEQKAIQLEQKTIQLEQKITPLEEKINRLEGEMANMKINLTNTATTLGMVSKNNLDLEKKVEGQTLLIQNLMKQNDSLLAGSKVKKDEDWVTSPKNEEDSIIFLIQSYYACKKWEDRLAYILKPETVKPFMQTYYGDTYESVKVNKEKISIQGDNFKNNEIFKVILGGSRIMYCKKINSIFKIDWEATTGCNPISLRTFQANLNNNPTEFRVKVKLGNFYSYNYIDASKTHWNCQIYDDNGNGMSFCYISKSSPEGKKLYEILKDGQEHSLILELKIDTTEDTSGNTAIITRLVKEGWVKE